MLMLLLLMLIVISALPREVSMAIRTQAGSAFPSPGGPRTAEGQTEQKGDPNDSKESNLFTICVSPRHVYL